MSQENNPYYPKLKNVISVAMAALSDGKVSMSEVWMFLIILAEAIQTAAAEAADFSDDDLIQLKEAATLLYDEYVAPLDLPGPDYIVDPLLRNGILPGLVEAAFRLAKSRLEQTSGSTAEAE